MNENIACFSQFASEEDNLYNINLSIENIRCASCIGLVEKTLYAHKEVESARVNMSTKRLTVSWKGSKEIIDDFANEIINLGYNLSFDNANDKKIVSQESKLLRYIAVSGFASGNLMMISVGLWSSSPEIMGIATTKFFHIISTLIAIPAILYSGQAFFKSALKVISQKHTNMDVPISLAIILATFISIFETINNGDYIYYESVAMLIFFLLIGRYLDIKARGKAYKTAQKLLSMVNLVATIITNDKKHQVIAVRDIRENMIVNIAMGEKIPVDGKIIKGTSDIDTSLITGETLPKSVKINDMVFAGTTNISAPLQVKVTKTKENSLLSDIVKLMEKAEQSKSNYVRLADKASSLYTPIVHFLGLVTFLIWYFVIGEAWQLSLLISVTVLIITCPCALGLAVPVVQILASSKLMNSGILLKSGNALEKLSNIDIAIFDKTGTLTLGHPILQKGDWKNKDLQIAVSLAKDSKHPLSKAICNAYKGELLEISDIEEIPGKGIQGKLNNKIIKLGSSNFCQSSIDSDDDVLRIYLSKSDKEIINFTFIDDLREDAKEIIDKIKNKNIKTILLSGDREKTVKSVANILDIDEYYFALSPVEKCEYINNLKKQNKKILMVGDGLNDAPSLAASDVSISPSNAIDIAQNAADIVFQGKKLFPILDSICVAQKTVSLVKQNFALAVLYNIIAIPIAITGNVTPMIAAIAMSSSSLIVIANSFRLNYFKSDR